MLKNSGFIDKLLPMEAFIFTGVGYCIEVLPLHHEMSVINLASGWVSPCGSDWLPVLEKGPVSHPVKCFRKETSTLLWSVHGENKTPELEREVSHCLVLNIYWDKSVVLHGGRDKYMSLTVCISILFNGFSLKLMLSQQDNGEVMQSKVRIKVIYLLY